MGELVVKGPATPVVTTHWSPPNSSTVRVGLVQEAVMQGAEEERHRKDEGRR